MAKNNEKVLKRPDVRSLWISEELMIALNHVTCTRWVVRNRENHLAVFTVDSAEALHLKEEEGQDFVIALRDYHAGVFSGRS